MRALNTATALTVLRSAHDEARRLVDESLAIASVLGDRAGEARARVWLGFIDLTGDPPSTRHSEQSLAINEALGDRPGICRSLLFLGIGMSQFAETKEQGYEALKRAAHMARELEDGWSEAFARIFLGWASIDASKPAQAATHLRAALVTEALGPIRGTALDAFASLAVEQDPAEPSDSSQPRPPCASATAADHRHGSGAERQRSANGPSSCSTRSMPSRHGAKAAA